MAGTRRGAGAGAGGIERARRARNHDRDHRAEPTHEARKGDSRSILGHGSRAFLLASRIVIVAGKGGVGKTTVTAALATAATRTGMSVLIVEVEGKSGLAACFDSPPLTYEEQEIRPGLRARTLTPDEALLEYLEDHGMRRISRRLTAAAPSTSCRPRCRV